MARKRKSAETREDTSIFEHFGLPEGGRGSQQEREDDAKRRSENNQTSEAGLAQLMRRLDALEKQNQSLQSANMALLSSQGGAKPQKQAPQTPGVDLSGLPDPVQDPDKYHKELNARLTRAISENVRAITAAEREQMTLQSTQKDRVDALWSEFREKYGDLAKNEEFVSYAADRVVDRARRKGVDTERYMFTTSDQFIDDVAAEVRKTFGKVLDPADDDDRDEAERDGDDDREDDTPDDDNDERAAGLFGGPGTSGGGKKGGGEPKGDMIKDLTDLQRSSGFF